MRNLQARAFVSAVVLCTAATLEAGDCVPARAAEAIAFQSKEVSFVANEGQWPESVLFSHGSGPFTSWITREGFVMQAPAGLPTDGDPRQACALEFRLRGTEHETFPVLGERIRAARYHYLLGSEPDSWATDVAGYGQVRFQSPWAGIDLCLRELSPDSAELEYDLYLQPGADLRAVQIEVLGATRLTIGADGQLRIQTGVGEMQHTPPVSWFEWENGVRRSTAVRFRLLDEHTFGFEAAEQELQATLVVDPGIHWSTFLGDLDLDLAQAITHAKNGDLVVAGETLSPQFPVTRGVYDLTWNGGYDAFVSRFRGSTGQLLYSTLLGGSDDDRATGVCLRGSQEIWLAGSTRSVNFPTLSTGFDNSHNGGWDGFVVLLAPNGGSLRRMSFLGSTENDMITDLACDLHGRAVVCGASASSNFPVTPGSYGPFYNGG
ncbi:MAG: hypothetical protein ACI9F9_003329, partial [Candidatus Paceibacteria bacterium]